MMISSIVLSLRRERAGGAGPVVEAPRLAPFVLVVPPGAAVLEPSGSSVVNGLETLPILLKASGAELVAVGKDGVDVVVVSAGLFCG